MADTILVVVEQREGKLNRVSLETLAGAQALAAETGWTLEAAVAGSGVGDIANEIAAKKVARVYDIESAKLEPYTPDGFVAALKSFIRAETAQAGADAAHLPGARLCPKTCGRSEPGAHQRRRRLQVRGRQAAVYPADVPRQIRG
jgi:electron transfer flavoprotein alpha subunit